MPATLVSETQPIGHSIPPFQHPSIYATSPYIDRSSLPPSPYGFPLHTRYPSLYGHMGTGLNPYMLFYSPSTPMPPMAHSGHPYLASVTGQKLSLETQIFLKHRLFFLVAL